MYGIYGNIYHQYTPNVSIYTSTMDPMGSTFKVLDTVLLLPKELPLRFQCGHNPMTKFPSERQGFAWCREARWHSADT